MAYSVKFDKAYYRKYNTDKCKNSVLKKKYGITLEQYNQMFTNQNGNCAICGRNQSEFKTSLNIDHCHKTNKIRGLLCSNCNTALGLFNDDNVLLQKAINYNKG